MKIITLFFLLFNFHIIQSSELLKAIFCENFTQATNLIENNNYNLNQKISWGMFQQTTPLCMTIFIASKYNDDLKKTEIKKFIEKLIEFGANPHEEDYEPNSLDYALNTLNDLKANEYSNAYKTIQLIIEQL